MTERLKAAARTHKRDQAKAENSRRELAAAIVDADAQGVPQVEIVAITGYTRERIRQIVKAAAEESSASPPPSQ